MRKKLKMFVLFGFCVVMAAGACACGNKDAETKNTGMENVSETQAEGKNDGDIVRVK